MKKILLWLGGIVAVLFVVYLLGPKPTAPSLTMPQFSLPSQLTDLEKQINTDEMAVPGIRPGCQARIVWADSAKKEKTKIAFLYIHGFSATEKEGDPVHKDIAKKYGANLYLARLAGHGIDLGDSTMKDLTSDDLVNSAEKALAIAKQLGNEVVIIATSFGGALTTYLAAHHPEIKAIVLYSPCIKIYDDKAELLDNHWGLEIAKLVNGSEIRDYKPWNEEHGKYWSTHYHLNGVIAIQNFMTVAMNKETFAQIKCPTFLGYYYKNEEEQDKVVSVPAMLKMYDELGVVDNLKRKIAFPKAGNHVLASYVLSKDYQGVEKETDKFLKEVVKL